MGQHGYRNMYHLTGLPGWMRAGYGPGWCGRGGRGMGPRGQFLRFGQWPTPRMQAYWQSGDVPNPASGQPDFQPFGMPTTPEQELQVLKNQAEMLVRQLEGINQRISELEQEK